jgi:hypothetical protein
MKSWTTNSRFRFGECSFGLLFAITFDAHLALKDINHGGHHQKRLMRALRPFFPFFACSLSSVVT